MTQSDTEADYSSEVGFSHVLPTDRPFWMKHRLTRSFRSMGWWQELSFQNWFLCSRYCAPVKKELVGWCIRE